MRQKIYFLPVYIGSLKYCERIFPYLKDKYDVRFLIVKGEGVARKQMIDYCNSKNHKFEIIDEGLNSSIGIRIPFLSPIKKRYKFIKECREFLKNSQPSKFIYPRDSVLISDLIREANRVNIDTIQLQWVPIAGEHKHLMSSKSDKLSSSPLLPRVYGNALKFLYRILDTIYLGSRYIRLSSEPKKIGVASDDVAKIFGSNFNLKKVRVVGMIDYQLTNDLKNRIANDSSYREKLTNKYNINLSKLNIIFLSQYFYLKIKAITIEEQVAHFHNAFKIVRDIFPIEEADILFKLHPSEKNIYEQSEEELGVKIYDDESLTEELVCLSDLSISDHWTTANCIVIASDIPAIFINFPPMQSSKDSLDAYKIKETVDDKKVFVEKLRQFKNNSLDKQYDSSHIDLKSIEKIIALIEE